MEEITIGTRKARSDGWHGGKRQHIDLFLPGRHVATVALTPLMTEADRLKLAYIFKAAPLMHEALQQLETAVTKSHGVGRVGCGVPNCPLCSAVMKARIALEAASDGSQ